MITVWLHSARKSILSLSETSLVISLARIFILRSSLMVTGAEVVIKWTEYGVIGSK